MKQQVAIIGHGTVGKALYAQISDLANFEIAKVVVKHPEKHNSLSKLELSTNALQVIRDENIDVILEAIDNEEDALQYALETLKLGKTYISASKKMVARNLSRLLMAERESGGKLLFEAAVGGCIPVIRTLREHYRGEEITGVRGIVNGSCNYILTRMMKDGLTFDEGLKQAQELGFAETDPSSDVDAIDSYYKAVIIAYAILGERPDFGRIKVEGIRAISSEDIRMANRNNQKIKLIADVRKQNDKFSIDIRPRLVEIGDPLYNVEFETNAVVIDAKYSGSVFLQGAGAGGNPTASAMVGDLFNSGSPSWKKVKDLILAMN